MAQKVHKKYYKRKNKMFEFMSNLKNGKTLSLNELKDSEGDPYSYYMSGFWGVSENDLRVVESELGEGIPSQLREFYKEVGVGTIRDAEIIEGFSYNNILFPQHLPKVVSGKCKWLMPYAEIQPDTLPFFERDVDLFLCLHPHSDNPNAVWWMWGDKICDSLVEFFQKLVDDPDWFNPPVDRTTDQ
jgi:hypothetical protein